MMQLKPREVIVLKPTATFLSFLAAQLPGTALPDLNLLQTDTTAYTFPQHETEEALLNSLEANFTRMFQHEIKRWVGDEAPVALKASFLDFLCCFKFEVHDHLIVLESEFAAGQQLLRIKPRSFFLKKMQADAESLSDDGDVIDLVQQVSLSHLTENATVIIKQFEALSDVHPFLKQYYLPIFKMEMMRVCESREQWPEVHSFEMFSRYFLVDVHTSLVHLDAG